MENVGELLFEYYLRDKLDEELYEHLWRFEPVPSSNSRERSHGTKYDSKCPILSKDMKLNNSFGGFGAGFGKYDDDDDDDSESESEANNAIAVGTEMIFFYDEGSPTTLFVCKLNHIYFFNFRSCCYLVLNLIDV